MHIHFKDWLIECIAFYAVSAVFQPTPYRQYFSLRRIGSISAYVVSAVFQRYNVKWRLHFKEENNNNPTLTLYIHIYFTGING